MLKNIIYDYNRDKATDTVSIQLKKGTYIIEVSFTGSEYYYSTWFIYNWTNHPASGGLKQEELNPENSQIVFYDFNTISPYETYYYTGKAFKVLIDSDGDFELNIYNAENKLDRIQLQTVIRY